VPFDDPRIHDSDEILELERLPRTLAVVGAGVIGCEYTTIFGALGIKVSLIDGRDRLLGFLDGEIADQLRLQMGVLGVDLRLRESVTRHWRPSKRQAPSCSRARPRG
jgi:NAD(P) transhydrogenase